MTTDYKITYVEKFSPVFPLLSLETASWLSETVEYQRDVARPVRAFPRFLGKKEEKVRNLRFVVNDNSFPGK